MRQHNNLPAMMRLMRENVRKHRPTGGPDRNPTPAREFRNPPRCPAGQGICQHPQTLRCALLVRGRRLLDRAPERIERRGTLQMRSGILDPHQPAVMQVRKDRPNRPPSTFRPRQLGAPSPRIEVLQQKLVHRIVDGICLQQTCSERSRIEIPTLRRRYLRPSCHETSALFKSQNLFLRIVILSEASARAKASADAQSKDPYLVNGSPGTSRNSLDDRSARTHRRRL
jgi:hypothetical protein